MEEIDARRLLAKHFIAVYLGTDLLLNAMLKMFKLMCTLLVSLGRINLSELCLDVFVPCRV